MAIRKAGAATAAQAVGSGDVIEELRRRYDRLTQSQKRIAEYIVEHSQAVAFSTVDQMAAQLDVNPSTIVRFTYRIGLNGFPDLQERMRELVRGQLSRTSDPINESQVAGHLEGTSFGASLSHDERTELDEAKEFLRDALAEGRMKAKDVQAAARAAGHAPTTLGRARRDLRVQFKRDGFGAGSQIYWWLKDDEPPFQPPSDAPSEP